MTIRTVAEHSEDASAPPIGVPSPEAMSKPLPAGYRPPLVELRSLLPDVTSLKVDRYALPAARYRAGLANPIADEWHALDALMMASSAAHTGAAALVPPIDCHPAGDVRSECDPFQ